MMNNKWTNTCKALKKLFEILSCSKCEKSLHDPQQFLHCGHFLCVSCINNENAPCAECHLPRENGNTVKDNAINQIIQTCCTIAKEIGFQQNLEDVNVKSENVGSIDESDSKPCISGNILTPKNSKAESNLPKKGKKSRKRKGNKNLNNNEDSKKAKYDKCSTTLRIPKDINKTNHHGETLLQTICKKGNVENIKLLLDAGANPNVADYAKWTPLQETVDFKYYEASKLLLENGADVNLSGHEGRTPLHEAARNNDLKMVKLLLEYKASKELIDKDNKRPVDHCQLEEIKKLLNCDEEIEIIYEKRNNCDYNINNANCKIDQTISDTNAFENCQHLNNVTQNNPSASLDIKEQKIKISNIEDSIFMDSEEIDIMN